MKLYPLLLGTLLSALLLAGCVHPPKAYVAKDATESAVMAFAATKAPGLVVINVQKPTVPAEMLATAFAKNGIPYLVTLADAKDDSMQTSLTVRVDAKTLQLLPYQLDATPAPLTKVKPSGK